MSSVDGTQETSGQAEPGPVPHLTTGDLSAADRPDYLPRRPLPVEEAARWLGVCPQTVRNLFSDGQLAGYRVGRKILVYADGVERFKAANASPPPRAPVEPPALPEPEGRKPDVRCQPSSTRRGVRAFDRHSKP